MSGFFDQVLGGVKEGIAGNPNLRDFTHASKTFVTNAYGNAPKFKWLFHVYFDINKNFVSQNFAQLFPDTTNYGLLVKNITLPKFNIALSEMNQYNRKRYVQTKINYDPVNITFHDDNLSQIKNLWTQYYNYYYWDASGGGKASSYNTPGGLASYLNGTNIYNPSIANNQTWGYNGTPSANTNGGTKGPFFKSIRIYGFNQHDYAGYELINPIISGFGHDTYNYYETNGIMENQMTVKFETVNYFNGKLKGTDPGAGVDGFGSDAYYDRRTSPITKPGSTRSVLGQGGLLDSASNIYDNIANGNFLAAAATAYKTAKTFGSVANLKQSISLEVKQGAIGIIGGAAASSFVRGIVSSPSLGATTGSGSQKGSSTNGTNGSSTPPQIT